MSKGTPRITLRVHEALRGEIESAVAARNASKGNQKVWTVTEFIMQAVIDKLNHDRRGKRIDEFLSQEKPDDNMPRIILEGDAEL